MSSIPHHVVVIGSGFGGLFATKSLCGAPVEITLIARTPYHLFQPLIYQVATGILSEGEVAATTREILRNQKNVRVVQGDVTDVELDARTVTCTLAGVTTSITYDSLIVATGAGQSYFGNDGFAAFAPGLKSIDDALALRAQIFGAFEQAEVETDPDARRALLTFVVVGGGPTGVEMAGQLAELSQRSMKNNFRSIDPTSARVVLVEAGDRLLPTYSAKLSKRARLALEKRGVDVRVNASVTNVDANGVETTRSDGTTIPIKAGTKVWAAGVAASPLGRILAQASEAEVTRTGQVLVQRDLTLPGYPDVFVVGDLASLPNVAGVAQGAIQGGKFAAKQITRRLSGKPEAAQFRYRDKGTIATISRFSAVAKVGPVDISGFPAWALWLGVHLVYLVGFKNRLTVLMHWTVTFVGSARSERSAPAPQSPAPASTAGQVDDGSANVRADTLPSDRDLATSTAPA
jgi:NADH dehydrogenase